jgi:hypothetical protein
MLAAVAIAFSAGMVMVHDVAAVLVRAGRLQRHADRVQARLLAEESAVASFEVNGAGTGRFELGDATVVVRTCGTAVRIATRLGGGSSHGFAAEVLPGGAPAAFGAALTATTNCDDVVVDPSAVRREVGPSLDAAAVAQAVRADHTAWIQKEPALALQHWAAGTDGDDFVLVPNGDAAHDLLVVPGNLWLESGELPCEIVLSRDLVLAVCGNLYLGRSLRVRGPGRLVLVVAGQSGAPMFVDADGNGRWSAGDRLLRGTAGAWPLEGTGSVWIGLPGEDRAIVCDAGVVVGGALHLATDALVRGPLVLAHGVTRMSPRAMLRASGELCFQPDRERVPGFRASGRPRPGLLREVPAVPDLFADVSTSVDQTLVVSSPAR